MDKKKKIFAGIGFVASLTSLTTIMIPLLSLILVLFGVLFSLLGKEGTHKGMTYASIGMCLLALLTVCYTYISF
ncbi:MAG: hypothetical protein ACP5UA_12890 [Candidatus Hydrogenedens sp.]